MILKEVETLKKKIIKKLEDSKVENIEVIDTSNRTSIADYVIIGTGRSNKHIQSILENINLELKDNGLIGIKPEGDAKSGWVLLDAKDIIIHLFLQDVREKYNIEQIFEKKGV
jgi:ribosome-associated protein